MNKRQAKKIALGAAMVFLKNFDFEDASEGLVGHSEERQLKEAADKLVVEFGRRAGLSHDSYGHVDVIIAEVMLAEAAADGREEGKSDHV